MKRKLTALIFWGILLFLANYLLLIPWNPTAVSFWVMILVFGTLLLLILGMSAYDERNRAAGAGSGTGEPVENEPEAAAAGAGSQGSTAAGGGTASGMGTASAKAGKASGRKYYRRKKQVPVNQYVYRASATRLQKAGLTFFAAGSVLLLVAIGLCSPLFHAGNYAATLGEIQTTTFEEARPEADSVSNIALIDTPTASRIGSRELGTLEDVVSQFVDGEYTQITYKGRVKKAAVVDYDGLFKYFNNRDTGTPGYLIVDPISGTAELIRTQSGIRYTPGAFLSRDIYRHLRWQYPTLLFGSTWFEIDEDGNPFWVTQVRRNRVFLSNPENTGIILTNAITGDSQRFALSEVPEWVDTVFDGDYVCEKYDYYGMLSGGFWNSVFGKRGCRNSTKCEMKDEDGDTYSASDFGYLADDKDIWIYTGVTSATSEDHSDIGMLMVNGRTGEAKYMTLAGADESSAMAAANGELQQYGYVASFPSIINVDGSPAYIMVMTDDNRIVKNYAMVNMQKYSQVVTGDTQNEVFRKYRRLVGTGKDKSADDTEGKSEISEEKILSAVYGSDEDGHYMELTFEDGSTIKYYMTD